MHSLITPLEKASLRTFLSHTVQVFGGAIIMALFAQVSIFLWFTQVPISGQNIAVMLVAALLGPKKGTIATILYLLEGAAGLPVFAGGYSGVKIFFGVSGGYLFGLPLLAYLTGWFLKEQKEWKSGKIFIVLLIFSIGHLLYGATWLARFVGLAQVGKLGIYPFIPGNVLKVILLTSWLKRLHITRL